jgi:hypothetical protein
MLRKFIEVGMNRKRIVVMGVAGLLTLIIVAMGVFIFIQRSSHGNASGFRPGMMMRGESGQSAAPSKLIAVSQEGTPVPTPANGGKLPENSASQKVGSLNVNLSLSPYPPASFKQTDFSVTLTDESGLAVTDATITLDLTMPEMPMPSNVLDVKPNDQGVYQSPGRFTMRGWWRIEVIIERGGQKQSAFFDLGL